MPELPEAETIARELDPPLKGVRIEGVRVFRPDVVVGDPEVFAARLVGETTLGASRRGKNVALLLESGARLTVNLGMSGRLQLSGAGGTDAHRHCAVRLRLSSLQAEKGRARVLDYVDPRRFGRLRVLAPEEWREFSESLGPEPLAQTFTARKLASLLQRSASPARSLLLDQRRIAGIGNIYAIEALWLARIHPASPGRTLSDHCARRLHRAIRRVLRDAILARGTTLRDYRSARGAKGRYAQELRVYGREGKRCRRCPRTIVRLVFGGRSAFYCPGCQGPWGPSS